MGVSAVQMTILFISLIGMSVVILVFLRAIGANATSATSQDSSADPERKRSRLIWGLLVGGIAVTAGSLWDWPHDAKGSPGSVSVNVTGGQWYWEIDKDTLPVGKEVIFNVHTKDVNHGMGVYGADNRLIFQVQAMPGYVNVVKHSFEKPGAYRILCMEFCGLAHHDMQSEFKVGPMAAGAQK
jgi:cytochrome c oxidase subunit II